MKPRTLRVPLPKRNCKNCGNEFTPYRSWQEFCSPRCRGIFYWKGHDTVRVDGKEAIVPVEAVPLTTNQEP